MKKIAKISFLLALLPSLSACQDVKHSIYAINVQGDFMVNLTVTQLLNLLENQATFMLEVYSPQCGHCEDMEVLLNNYVKKKHKLLYRFDLTQIPTIEEFNEKLSIPYNDIFPNSFVPSLQFIKESKLTYSVSPNKFDSYTGVSNELSKHFINTKMTMVQDYQQYEHYKNEYNNYVIASYSLDDPRSVNLIHRTLLNNSSLNKKMNILIVNQSLFSDEDFSSIKQEMNVQYDTFTAIYQNNAYKNASNYLLDEGASILNNINN